MSNDEKKARITNVAKILCPLRFSGFVIGVSFVPALRDHSDFVISNPSFNIWISPLKRGTATAVKQPRLRSLEIAT
jgi:hypothetical protein